MQVYKGVTRSMPLAGHSVYWSEWRTLCRYEIKGRGWHWHLLRLTPKQSRPWTMQRPPWLAAQRPYSAANLAPQPRLWSSSLSETPHTERNYWAGGDLTAHEVSDAEVADGGRCVALQALQLSAARLTTACARSRAGPSQKRGCSCTTLVFCLHCRFTNVQCRYA